MGRRGDDCNLAYDVRDLSDGSRFDESIKFG